MFSQKRINHSSISRRRGKPIGVSVSTVAMVEKHFCRDCETCIRTTGVFRLMWIVAATLSALLLLPVTARAVGTTAGTIMSNQATADYISDGIPHTGDSSLAMINVAEVLNVSVTSLDSSNIFVFPGAMKQALTMKVANTGNGQEAFGLSADTNVGGDQFAPTLANIYLDTNGNGIFDAGIDTLYTAGTNDPTIAADGYVTVFILCNIAADRVDGDLGKVNFTAAAKTGHGPTGTIFAGKGDGGTDSVVGLSTASMTVTGTYQVGNVKVSIEKTAVVVNPSGGGKAISGAIIKYTLTVTVIGSGTASGVIITDPIPANASYIAGTLKWNETALTDTLDTDAGDVGGTTAGTVTASVGNLVGGSPAQAITFDVKIN